MGLYNVSNLNHFRPLAQQGVMTTASFTTKLMASGEVEESRWAEPSVLNHITQFYPVVPNTELIVTSQAIFATHIYPGSHVSESILEFMLLSHVIPEQEAERLVLKKVFKFFMDVVAFEDFSVVYKLQNNFKSNPHAEVVFGRNENKCIAAHNWINSQIQGKY